MSRLRKHLQAETAQHQAAKYPGDLANDVLGAPRARVVDYAGRSTPRPISLFKLLGSLGALAAAAVLALVVWMKQEPSAPRNIALIQPVIEQEEAVPFAPQFAVSFSDDDEDQSIVPSDVGSIVPEYQSMSFPSIPSFSDPAESDETSQSTKES
jgi:hypothetical protein